MVIRDSCYFCTTPFQLIPTMALALNRAEEADLYIDPQFQNAEIISERIKETNVFCNVFVIDPVLVHKKYITKNSRLLKHMQIAFSYLKVNEIAKDLQFDKISYKQMFVSSRAYLPRLIQLYFLKNNIKTEVFYFEDGIGSYLSNAAYVPRISDRLVRRFLFGKNAVKFKHKKFLFSSNFYSLLNPSHEDEIEEIPQVLNNERLIKILNYIFQFNKKNALTKEKFILLDVLKSALFTENNTVKLIEIYNLIVEETGSENIILKKHPRDFDKRLIAINAYLNQDIPFEGICMNTDMNEKVLISYGTTALGTPKILFGQEPYLILLYHLVSSKSVSGNEYNKTMDIFFEKLKQLYVNKTKIFIPKDVSELLDALYAIKHE